MKTAAWGSLLLWTCACASHRQAPEDRNIMGEAVTSVRVGVVDGTARVRGRDAIPDRDATLAHLNIEQTNDGSGVGLRGSAFGGNWDLTGGGSSTQPEYSSLQVYPYFSTLLTNDVLRTPFRIGPEVRSHEVDQRSGPNGKTTYRSYGLALEFEPEWTFAQNDDFAASIYGRLHFGAGVSTIEDQLGDDVDLTGNFGGEIGINLRASRLSVRFGAQGQESFFAASEDEFGVRGESSKLGFHGLFLSLGAVF